MEIEHRHIEIFRAVMRAASVTGAAQILRTSQPTVSRELARFETLLGFALFERIRGRLQPTPRAHLLYAEVQRAWQGLDAVRATARGLRDFSAGPLALVCVPVFAQTLLPEACRRFHARLPEVGVSITPQESPLLEEWLSAQRFDLGLTEQDTAPPGCTLAPLLVADEVCVLPAGHRLLAKARLTLADFADEPFVSLAPADPYRQQVDALFATAGIARRMIFETQSAASVCGLAGAGLGVGIVNPLSALEHAAAGLAWRPLDVSIPFRVSLARPAFRPGGPHVETFAQALAEAAAALDVRLRAGP
ncbi:MAG: LysR family transcriptional regulator [Candidatus Dactylopiibacterium sp.]|nr:LysR family transcriptional regulator [Candidatus Dactylopiibacterium sp.]